MSDDERDKHSGERDDRRAPTLEEKEHDQRDQENGLEERAPYGVDRLFHEDGRVINTILAVRLRSGSFPRISGAEDMVHTENLRHRKIRTGHREHMRSRAPFGRARQSERRIGIVSSC